MADGCEGSGYWVDWRILLKRQVAELCKSCSTVRSSSEKPHLYARLRKEFILLVCATFKCGPHAGTAYSIRATAIPLKIICNLS